MQTIKSVLTSRRTKKILDDNPELQKQWTSLIPVGKMGRPEDLMGAVTFLSSDASLYVTVSTQVLCGMPFLTIHRVRICALMEPTLALKHRLYSSASNGSLKRIQPDIIHRQMSWEPLRAPAVQTYYHNHNQLGRNVESDLAY